jgi:uncharacterized protein YggU (UPF0235/DUF167 family)
MKIIVKAKSRAKENKVERVGQPKLDFDTNEKEEMVTYKVSVKAVPVNGRANEAIIKSLAIYFDTSPSSITLISGQTSKQKVFEIHN